VKAIRTFVDGIVDIQHPDEDVTVETSHTADGEIAGLGRSDQDCATVLGEAVDASVRRIGIGFGYEVRRTRSPTQSTSPSEFCHVLEKHNLR